MSTVALQGMSAQHSSVCCNNGSEYSVDIRNDTNMQTQLIRKLYLSGRKMTQNPICSGHCTLYKKAAYKIV